MTMQQTATLIHEPKRRGRNPEREARAYERAQEKVQAEARERHRFGLSDEQLVAARNLTQDEWSLLLQCGGQSTLGPGIEIGACSGPTLIRLQVLGFLSFGAPNTERRRLATLTRDGLAAIVIRYIEQARRNAADASASRTRSRHHESGAAKRRRKKRKA